METLAFEATSGAEIRLGISVGWATYPRDGHSYEALVKKADRRMYHNKSARKSNPSAVGRPPQPDRPLGAPSLPAAPSPQYDRRSCARASISSCRSR